MTGPFGIPQAYIDRFMALAGGADGIDLRMMLEELREDPMPTFRVNLEGMAGESAAFYTPKFLVFMPEGMEEEMKERKAAFDEAAARDEPVKFKLLQEWAERQAKREQRHERLKSMKKDASEVLSMLLRDSKSQTSLQSLAVNAVTAALQDGSLVNILDQSGYFTRIAQATADDLERRAKDRFDARPEQRLLNWIKGRYQYFQSFWDAYFDTDALDRSVVNQLFSKGERGIIFEFTIEEVAMDLAKSMASFRGWRFYHRFFAWNPYQDLLQQLGLKWEENDEKVQAEEQAYQMRLRKLVPPAIEHYFAMSESVEEFALIMSMRPDDIRPLMQAACSDEWRHAVLAYAKSVSQEDFERESPHYMRVLATIPREQISSIMTDLMLDREIPASANIQAVLETEDTINRVLAGDGSDTDFSVLIDLDQRVLWRLVNSKSSIEVMYDAVHTVIFGVASSITFREQLIYNALNPIELDHIVNNLLLSECTRKSEDFVTESPASTDAPI